MKLTGFRVQMFKGVIDSGSVELEDLTVLVGKNEAGKTTLLKALHKLNPATPEPYEIEREWPRGRRSSRSEEQVVCTGRFNLDASELDALRKLTDQSVELEFLDVTRNYANNIEVLFPEALFPQRLHPNDVDRVCGELPELAEPAGEAFRAAVVQAREKVQRLARDGLFSGLANIAKQQNATLSTAYSPNEPELANEQQWLTQYTAKLKELVQRLPKESIHAKAHEYVVRKLPKFIYMDDYRTFEGDAILNQVKERRDQKKSTKDDETFLMLLALSGLKLDALVASAGEEKREMRQYDLDDASRTLTKVFSERLQQREYEIQFRADGQWFYTMVKDKTEVGLLKLEERSKGFQWFFSFDMLFMHESQGTFENCVVLLDEPGLHLHPGAQSDLLARLDEYAKGNTLVYSTHLPFMLDLRRPERIRVINESDNGAVVTEDLTLSQPEAKLTLQAALGMSGRTSYLVANKNVLVEGADDFMLLSALSELLVRSRLGGLSEETMITAGGGASEAAYIATFMIGQKLDVVVLLDSDGSGETARDKLVKSWLTRYKGKESQVLCLGDVVGVTEGQFAIEDLFPDDFYLDRVKEVYAKQLAAAEDQTLTLSGSDQLCKRVERALAGKGIPYNKGSVAKRIRRDITQMKDASELPPETKERAIQVFERLMEALT